MSTPAVYRNIHAAAEEADQPSNEFTGRLRRVTNDPLREYAGRAGNVEPLPDSIAALILAKKGKAQVRRGQIVATIDGVAREYASRESMVIAELDGTDTRVLWFANRRKPECIHLCTDDGRYLETLPLKGEATWLSHDEASKAAHGAAVAHRQAQARRLALLHEPDVAAAAAREKHNGAEIAERVREDERTVRLFPASSGSDAARAVGGSRFPHAEGITAAMDNVEEQRARRAERVVSEAAHLRKHAGDIADFLEAPEPAAAPPDESPADDLSVFLP